MSRAVLTLLLAGLFVTPVVAEEKFIIKFKKDANGDVTRVTETDSRHGKTSVTGMGKDQTREIDSVTNSTYTEYILEKEAGKLPSKSKRVYEKAEGNKSGKKLELSFIGKEILITRDGKKVEYTIDGKELAGDEKTFLNLKLETQSAADHDKALEDIMIPKQAVAVNASWNLDMNELAKEFAKERLICDAAMSSGKGKVAVHSLKPVFSW